MLVFLNNTAAVKGFNNNNEMLIFLIFGTYDQLGSSSILDESAASDLTVGTFFFFQSQRTFQAKKFERYPQFFDFLGP